MTRKFLSLLLVLCLIGGLSLPVQAAEEVLPAPLPAWSYDQLADAYALGLCGDELHFDHAQAVTMEQIDALCAVVAAKLALLDAPVHEADGAALVVDTTRGGVVNALYQTAAAWGFPGVESGAVEYLVELGVLQGDGVDLCLDRPCTYLEAVVLANRLVLNLYDLYNAGSLGLLWKAASGENTLYLLGTIHMDRDNVYPFHKQLRELLTSVELAAFELDFGDVEGLNEFAAMMLYTDGTTLKDHIDGELYADVVEAMATLGVPEILTAMYKPWALASTLQSVSLTDESSGDTIMAVDTYCYAKAVNVGVAVEGVETYAFQGGLFDNLSAEYQEEYLASSLALFQGEENHLTEEEQAEMKESLELMSAWMANWKARDIAAFESTYDKEAAAAGEDELEAQLFAERDPNMTAWAARYLDQEGSHTGILIVGAGHMIGDTGIVQSLQDQGYAVEQVPVL